MKGGSAHLLLQGQSPTQAQVFAGDRQSMCCTGVGPDQVPACADPATTPQSGDSSAVGAVCPSAQSPCPSTACSEVLWVSQYKWGLPKSEPGAGMIQHCAWSRELSPAGAEICNMKHEKRGRWLRTETLCRLLAL